MKITKYEHACFTVEKDGKLLVIDPGAFTHDLGAPENVAVIVVTHEHADHFDPAALGALIAHNPSAIILAHESITAQLGDTLPNRPVSADEEIDFGPFNLKFYGGEHALIHSLKPVIPNLGVLIDQKVYYPGDSFVRPDEPVDILALPVSAPWLKAAESMDFLMDIKPRLAFSTHDSLLSESGEKVTDTWMEMAAEKCGATYRRLQEPLEI